jgi:hypothetical protein
MPFDGKTPSGRFIIRDSFGFSRFSVRTVTLSCEHLLTFFLPITRQNIIFLQ